MLEIANVVCKATMDRHLNLDLFASDTEGVVLLNRARNFKAAKIKFGSGTFMAFPSGVILCLGSKSVDDARIDVELLSTLLDANVVSFCLCNIVFNGALGSRVRLNTVFETNPATCSYEAELYPALYYKPDRNGSSLMALFSTGKFYITGVMDLPTAEQLLTDMKHMIKCSNAYCCS